MANTNSFLYRNLSKTFKDPSFKNELNKLPNQIKQKWIKEISETDTIIDKNSLRYSKWLEEATGKLHKKNVPFMAGTDTPIGYLILVEAYILSWKSWLKVDSQILKQLKVQL